MSARAKQAIAHLASALSFRARMRPVELRNQAVRWYWERWADEHGGDIRNHMLRMADRPRASLLADLAALTGLNADSQEHHALIEYALAHNLMLQSEAGHAMKSWHDIFEGKEARR